MSGSTPTPEDQVPYGPVAGVLLALVLFALMIEAHR